MTSLEIVLAVTAVAAGCTLQRVSGMGVGLVVSPVLALLIGPAVGVWLTNVVSIVSALVIWRSMGGQVDRERLKVIIPCAVLGAVPAALVVRFLPSAWLQIVVGGILVLALVASSLAAAAGRMPAARGRFAAGVAGVAGGFCNTTAGVAGPSLVVYSRLSRWDHATFTSSLQPTFFVMGALSAGVKLGGGAVRVDQIPDLWVLAVLAATVVAIVPLASRFARRVPSSSARRLALAVAWAGALAAVVRGVLELVG
ncbi:hypothetical protein CZ771_06675 [Actinomycetales bacterium JB111]|nr:hypothetical protein CZ771_06675 [Actinomycetales bacterium JB111]